MQAPGRGVHVEPEVAGAVGPPQVGIERGRAQREPERAAAGGRVAGGMDGCRAAADGARHGEDRRGPQVQRSRELAGAVRAQHAKAQRCPHAVRSARLRKAEREGPEGRGQVDAPGVAGVPLQRELAPGHRAVGPDAQRGRQRLAGHRELAAGMNVERNAQQLADPGEVDLRQIGGRAHAGAGPAERSADQGGVRRRRPEREGAGVARSPSVQRRVQREGGGAEGQGAAERRVPAPVEGRVGADAAVAGDEAGAGPERRLHARGAHHQRGVEAAVDARREGPMDGGPGDAAAQRGSQGGAGEIRRQGLVDPRYA